MYVLQNVMRIVISLGFCRMILMLVEANVSIVCEQLFKMEIRSDFLSFLLFIGIGCLGKIMGVLERMEVVVEVVVKVVAKLV